MIYFLDCSWLLTDTKLLVLHYFHICYEFCFSCWDTADGKTSQHTSQLYIFLSSLLFFVLGFKKYFLLPIPDILYFAHLFLFLAILLSWIFFFWSILIFPLSLVCSFYFFILSSPFMPFLLTCINSNFSCILRQGWLLFFTKNTYGTSSREPSWGGKRFYICLSWAACHFSWMLTSWIICQPVFRTHEIKHVEETWWNIIDRSKLFQSNWISHPIGQL